MTKKHLLEPSGGFFAPLWADRIQLNVKKVSRLEGLIKIAYLIGNLAAICTPSDYNKLEDLVGLHSLMG